MCNNNSNSSNIVNGNNVPEVIIVCTEESKMSATWYKGYQEIKEDLENGRMMLSTIEEIKQNGLVLEGNPRKDDIYIRLPFCDKEYIKAEDGKVKTENKFEAYKEVFQLLGVKEYKITSVTSLHSKRSVTVDAGVEAKTVNVQGNVDWQKELGTHYHFKSSGVFDGCRLIGEYEYQKAKKLVSKYHLDNDNHIISLINRRNPDVKNKQVKDYVELSMCEELNKCLDVVAKVSCAGIFNIDANVKTFLETKEEITLSIEVTFPEKGPDEM